MSRINFALGVLVLPLSLLSIQAQTPMPIPGTANVSGVVTLKGKPLCSVFVEMADQGEGQRRFHRRRVRTDENGRFRIEHVASGKYWITARAPGHTSPGNDGRGTSGQSLDVAEGAKIENIALEIKSGGVITGRITDSRGDPAAEEEVIVHRLDKDGDLYEGAFGTRTNDRGVYRFYGLPEGRYLAGIGYEKDSRGHPLRLRAFYPNVASKSEAKVIEVTLGSENTDIDITLPDSKHRSIKEERTGEITVRLVTEDGVGLPNVKVVITLVAEDGRSISTSGGIPFRATDENGNFKIPEIGPKDGPSFYQVKVFNARGYAPKHRVNQRVGDDITVTMIKGGVITGRITNAEGNPVIATSLIVAMVRDAEGKPMPMLGNFEPYSDTDDRGVYRLWGLTPGIYVVYSYNRGNSACPFAIGEYVPIYYPSSTREKAAEVTVRSGVEVSGIDIRYREDRGRIK